MFNNPILSHLIETTQNSELSIEYKINYPYQYITVGWYRLNE